VCNITATEFTLIDVTIKLIKRRYVFQAEITEQAVQRFQYQTVSNIMHVL